jgi:hypothetical protein
MRVGVGGVGEEERRCDALSRIVAERDRKEEVTYVSQLVRYTLSFLITL